MKNLSNISLVIGLTFVPLSTMLSQTNVNGSIMHDGIERTYMAYIPANYSEDKPVPVLFNFHGYTSNAEEQMIYGDFRSISDTAGFILIHPQGTSDIVGNPFWNVGWTNATVDDVDFTLRLLDTLDSEYNIDLERIYTTGMSNGGFFSYELACQASYKFAAIASVTGSMSQYTVDNCNRERPVPTMEIHGTSDAVVAYNGSNIATSIPDVILNIIEYNECNTTPTTTSIDDIDTDDGSTVEHIIYGECTNDAAMEHFKIEGGGHTWPGSVIRRTGTNYDIDASHEIWKFFSRYDIHGLRGGIVSNEDLKEDDLNVIFYPNPTSSDIKWRGEHLAGQYYQIFSTDGKLVRTSMIPFGEPIISLSDLSPQLYILKIGGENYKISVIR